MQGTMLVIKPNDHIEFRKLTEPPSYEEIQELVQGSFEIIQCFCALGATYRAAAEAVLASTLIISLQKFNDQVTTTHKDILDHFDKTIKITEDKKYA